MAGRRKGRILRRALLHAALLAGSLLFAGPFIWLLSTSAKAKEEMYPPRWIPEIPPPVNASPYIMLRTSEHPRRPALVAHEDWERAQAPIRSAITARLEAMANELPEFYRPHLGHADLADGVFSRLVARAPDELFAESEDAAAAWFAGNVSLDLAQEVFEAVYRRAAVADVKLHGWDLSAEFPTENGAFHWEVTEGDATLVDRPTGLLKPMQEIHYSFAKSATFAVQTIVPMKMAPETFRKVVVTIQGDGSWHEIWATIEFASQAYKAAHPAHMGTDRSQDITWQVRSKDDHKNMIKSWIRLDPAGPSSFAEPGKLRVTLEYRRQAHPVAALNKYTENYRKVVRYVPLASYLRNSFLLVFLNIAGQVIGSSLVAYAFARLRWPGRDFCFVLVLATLMIPPQVTMIPVFLIFKELGWYNTLKPLWVPAFFGSAFYIFLLRQFMLGIPTDLEDSAKIDGCSYFGIYRRIIVPLIKPALATIGIFTFMTVWNDFMGPLIYLSSQDKYPLSLGLLALKVFQTSQMDQGVMMSASVLMTLPVVALFFLAQRQFIQGITLTGLKG